MTDTQGLKVSIRAADLPIVRQLFISIGSINMSKSTNPISSFSQEKGNRNPCLKLSLKDQISLPNLFESLNLLDEEKPKPCSQCSMHIKRVFTRMMNQPHNCSICDCSFTRIYALKIHMARIHEVKDNLNSLNSSNTRTVRSRVKSFDGKKGSLNRGLGKNDDSQPLPSLKIFNTDEVWEKIETSLVLRLRPTEDIKKESQCKKELSFDTPCKMYENEVNELQGLLEKNTINSEPLDQNAAIKSDPKSDPKLFWSYRKL